MKTNFNFYTIKNFKNYLIQSIEVDIKQKNSKTPCSIRNIDRLKFSDELLDIFHPNKEKEEAVKDMKEVLNQYFILSPDAIADSYINFKISCSDDKYNPYSNEEIKSFNAVFNNPYYRKDGAKLNDFVDDLKSANYVVSLIPDNILTFSKEDLHKTSTELEIELSFYYLLNKLDSCYFSYLDIIDIVKEEIDIYAFRNLFESEIKKHFNNESDQEFINMTICRLFIIFYTVKFNKTTKEETINLFKSNLEKYIHLLKG